MTHPPVGITISCYLGDLPLLRGCITSLRKYIPDTPVCLIKHGEFDTDHICKYYNVSVLDRDIVNSELDRYSYGYGLTKMIAFWHSPFDRFLHVDPDTIFWGDPFEGLPINDFDLIYNEPHEIITSNIQRQQYFDPEKIFPPLKDYGWEGRPYFNTGTFFARRGMFELAEYLEILNIQRSIPGSFFTDQGVLNFMTFRGISEGRIRARDWPFQVLTPLFQPKVLEDRFAFRSGRPVVKEDDRRIIHWAGRKPFVRRPVGFDRPMVHFRLLHLARWRPLARPLGRIALFLEEIFTQVSLQYGGNPWRAVVSKLHWWVRRAGESLARRRTAAVSRVREPVRPPPI